MNKVLNRPMFRKEALRKGHLKPIKANIGTLVGQPYSPPGVPAVSPGQGVFSPVNTQRFGPPAPTRMQNIMRSTPVRFAKGIANIPAYLGYEGTGLVADAMGMKDSPYKMPLQIAGAMGATKLPGAAGLSSIGFLPSLGILSVGGLGYMGKKAQEKFDALPKKEQERIKKERAAFGDSVEDFGSLPQGLFGKFVPKAPEPVTPKTSAVEPGKPKPGEGRVGIDRAKLKQEGDTLLSDQFEGPEGDASLDKIQTASMPGGVAPVPPATTDTEQPAEPEPKLNKIEKQQDEAATTAAQTGVSVPGDATFDQTIRLAKKYFNEMDEGAGSQAGLLFLANLASGLLTGTTRKGGIGGAMEVLGQALGPAVNNYVTVKLKEGELRANRREASLNAALDHMKFLNEGAKMERPEIDSRGVIQFRGADGKLRNYRGFMGKDGTAYMPGGIGPDGREILIPIQQAGMIKDSAGNDIGTFQDFKAQKQISDRLMTLHDTLGNRYNALSVTRDVLRTLNTLDESSEKPKAGAALVVDTFTRRLGGVAKELVGLNVIDNDVTQLTLGQLTDKLEQLERAEIKKIEELGLSKEEEEAAKELIDRKRLKELATERLKDRGLFSGLNAEQQEKLAVQETTLVYALANTFKDQDRLTQRDIDAARNIVNIFSLTRSSRDVRASIKAISEQLEGDIRRQEELFRQAGGLETVLKDLRQLSELKTFEPGAVQQRLEQDLSLEEIEQGLEDVNL